MSAQADVLSVMNRARVKLDFGHGIESANLAIEVAEACDAVAELIERERMAREALEGFRADGVSGGKNFEGWHPTYDKAIEKARAYFARVGGA